MSPKAHLIIREILAGRPAANRYATLAKWLDQNPWTLPKPKNEPTTILCQKMLAHFIAVNGSTTTAVTVLHAAIMMIKELDESEQEYLHRWLERLL